MPERCFLERREFLAIASAYWRRWRIGLCAARADGTTLYRSRSGGWDGHGLASQRAWAIEESVRWGEPTIQPAPGGILIWAAPVMHNARVCGGVVAGVAERRLFARRRRRGVLDVRAACADLRQLLEEHNLTNAAMLEAHRLAYQRERTRAEAIHWLKGESAQDIRALYLVEEPALVAAIRKGDRGEARAILNRLLVNLIHRAGERLELAKSFFMELVAMMSRTAVEAGAPPEELLGSNYDSLAKLAVIRSDESLAAWLHEMLERIMDAIRRSPRPAHSAQLAGALRFVNEHFARDIGRLDAARAACMSPSHFSRLFRRQTGRSFTQLLSEVRAGKAAEMLARSDRPLKLIALECGFADQSYFTKVFRRRYGMTPAGYRREHQITKL